MDAPVTPPLPRGSVLRGLIATARPRQWIKNAFVIAPVIFSGKFQDPAAVLLAAFTTLARAIGDEAVGMAIFFTNYSTFLAKPGIYVEDLFVKPHARGQGIGTALLKRIAQLAVERDCGRVEWSVLDWNEPSIRFYASLGAVAMKEWTVYRLTGEALGLLAEGN